MASAETGVGNALPRDVGVFGATSTVVAGTLGAGLFVTLGTAGETAGPSVIAVVAATGGLALCVAVSYSYLATIFPAAGSAYAYVSRSYRNRFVGFLVTWSKLLGYVAAEAVLALGFGSYLQVFVRGIDVTVAGVGLLTALFAINLVGVRRYSLSQTAIFALLVLALLVLVVPGTIAVDTANYRPFLAGGIDGAVAAAVPLFYAYVGIAVAGQLGAEVRNPDRTLPVAIVGGTAILVGLYVWTAAVIYGVVDEYAVLADSARPLATAGSQFLPVDAVAVVALGGLLATASSVHAVMAAAPKLPYAWAWDRAFPRWFARVNRRWRTPHWSLLVLYLAAAGLTLWTDGLDRVVDIAVFSYLVAYAAVAITAAYVRLRRPDVAARAAFDPGRWLYVLAGVAAGGSLLLLTEAQAGALVVYVPWLGVGVVVFSVCWYAGRRRDVDVAAILRTLPGVAEDQFDRPEPVSSPEDRV